MEVPKNLLNANSQQKQLGGDQRKMLPEGEKKSGGWMMFVIGLVIGAVLVWIFTGTKADNSDKVNMEDNVSTTTSMLDDTTEVEGETPVKSEDLLASSESAVIKTEVSSGNNSLTVKDQSAGMVVNIDSLEVSASTWVAVHEERNGTLGNILGARRFEPGMKSGVVELLRATVSGGTYHAVMYRDNGDREFNKTTDTKITNVAGSLIESVFKAQ